MPRVRAPLQGAPPAVNIVQESPLTHDTHLPPPTHRPSHLSPKLPTCSPRMPPGHPLERTSGDTDWTPRARIGNCGFRPGLLLPQMTAPRPQWPAGKRSPQSRSTSSIKLNAVRPPRLATPPRAGRRSPKERHGGRRVDSPQCHRQARRRFLHDDSTDAEAR